MTSKIGMFLAAVVALTTAACSGGSGSMSPTGPSGASGAQIAGRVSGVSMSSTASINGLSASPLTQVASPLTQVTSSSGPLKVSVNGTNIETSVDGTGHFTLSGVPAGTIVLNFTGRGVSASVTLRGVSSGDQIDIDVRLENGGARLESDRRRHGDDDGDDDNNDNDDNDDNDDDARRPAGTTVDLAGAVSSLSGVCPTLSFGLASRMVKTNSSTIFDNITCSAIRNTSRLRLVGKAQTDGVLVATRIFPGD